jgi:nicotinamide mononucleotide adenylyltransferase
MIAVYDGRFQPFHIGHLAFIERIHIETGLPVAVMVIHSTLSAEATGYSSIADQHHRPEKNPLTAWERVSLINQAITHAGFSFVSGILAIPRPDLHWPLARAFYPTERVICLSGKDDYERQKEVFWASLEEKTLVIDTDGLPKVSSTAVKQMMRNGEDWSHLIPEGGRAYFTQIDGYQRLRVAS